jgi:hypothetical protein
LLLSGIRCTCPNQANLCAFTYLLTYSMEQSPS